MNFKTAKDQIIKIIKNAKPATHNAIFSPSFKYINYDENRKTMPSSRTFMFKSENFSTKANQCFNKYRYADLVFSVFYRGESDRDKLEEAMADDYKVISNALLNVSNWDRAISGIVLLSTEDERILDAEVENEEELGVYLDFNIPVSYTD